jgi:hypothetical protein
MIRTDTPAGLDLSADRARRTRWIRSPAGWVRDIALDVRYLYRSYGVTRDRLEVWSYRKHGGDKGPLPPLRLRNGVLLKRVREPCGSAERGLPAPLVRAQGHPARCRRVLDAAGFRWREPVHPWDEGIIYGHRA